VIGDAGLVFPEGDAGELAARLDGLAGDPGERSRLAGLGRKRAEERFRADAVARRLYELFSASLPPRSR
jgi:glycosyltransferase involved in cell wall biosynthesis